MIVSFSQKIQEQAPKIRFSYGTRKLHVSRDKYTSDINP